MDEGSFWGNMKRTRHSFYIYGNGAVGRLCFMRMQDYGLREKCKGFLVSSREYGTEDFCGMEVLPVDEVADDPDETEVVVAAYPDRQPDFIRNLKDHCFRRIHEMPPALIDEMEQNYVGALNRNVLESDGDVDVLLMSSDNLPTSGAFLCLCDIAAELMEHKYRVLVVLPCFGLGEGLLTDANIPYAYILSENWLCDMNEDPNRDRAARNRKNGQAVRQIEGIIRKKNVRIVHNNTIFTYVGAEAARNQKVPFVWHVRENMGMLGKKFRDAGYAGGLMGESDAVVYVSQDLSASSRMDVGAGCRVIYDGVDIDKYYSEREILEGGCVSILMAGYMAEQKGQMDLLRALSIVRARTAENMNVVFAGNSEEKYIRELKEYIRQKDLRNVAFIGKQDHMEDVYPKHDIAVMASRAEPFGRVTVEAMCAGCLVIGADAGATPELIRDGESGLLYPAADAEALAERICFCIENRPEAKRIAKNGQQRAKNFSRARNAEAIMKLYEDIWERKRRMDYAVTC